MASADGISIAYEERGTGEPALVFVHGWSCDRTYWEAQMKSFSQAFKVISVDLGGHGESGGARTSWTIPAFGEDVSAVVRRVDPERIILIGHSMGGDVILEAAQRLTSRVIGLVWVDAYSKIGAPRDSDEVQALLEPFRKAFTQRTREFVREMFPKGSDPGLVERVVSGMSAAPPEVALGTLESAVSFDREVSQLLNELRLPVFAINPDSHMTDLASLRSHGVDALIMEGVGHFLMMEDPERFDAMLTKAIEHMIA